MRDAISETFDLTVLMVVIFIVCMIIAFAVNYSKAYRMKEYAISLIEKDNCLLVRSFSSISSDSSRNTEFTSKLYAEAKRLGYSPNISNSCNDGACNIYGVTIKTKNSSYTDSNNIIYENVLVTTYVGLDIPFVNKIFDFGYMKLTGETNYCENGILQSDRKDGYQDY